MKISYSIPTYLSNFSASVDGRTVAKLKTYYVGETEDGRVFTKEFAEKLMTTLPNCPVVAFYSDIKEDFCGHNSTQYIYGIVPADAQLGFEKDDKGVEWLVTDVLLYTDRIDNIGEIAQKIVGHPHSLEMHPETTKYEIQRFNGKRKIVFTEGSLVGLSVLGMSEKPAFKGSEFFKEDTEVREKFENFISFLENKDRGASMNKEQFEKLYSSFMALSYEEKQETVWKAATAIAGDYVHLSISQFFDEYCVFQVFDYSGEFLTISYKKVNYSFNESGEVILGDIVEVFPRFLTEDEMNLVESTSNQVEESIDAVFEDLENKEEITEAEEQKDEDQDKDEEEFNSNVNDTSNEGEENELQQTFEEEQQEQEDTTFSSTALSDSEREELEALRAREVELMEIIQANDVELITLRSNQSELEQYRLERRISLVNSYAEELPAETISAYLEMATDIDYEALEAKLAIEFVAYSKTKKQQNNVAFSFYGLNFQNENEAIDNSYEGLVKRYSKK